MAGGSRGTRGRRGEREAARATREVAERAARRLDVLEWVILGGAAAMAVLGGALVAFVLREALNTPFRVVWIVSSVLLFGVPGLVAHRRMRAEDRARRDRRKRE